MANNLLIFLTILVLELALGASIQVAADSPRCLDENGQPVDWYMAYKFPELNEESAPFNSGYAYAYITSESIKNRKPPSSERPVLVPNSSFFGRFNSFLRSVGLRRNSGDAPAPRRGSNSSDKGAPQSGNIDLYWTLSERLITDANSIVLRTLSIAYESNSNDKKTDKINSILYNDQPVEQSSGTRPRARMSSARAHAKGALLLDDITGKSIWLTHSTPHFPPPRSEKLRFLKNSRTYGQTFMCISFDLRQTGRQIVEHLINMHPLVYDSQVSDRLHSLIPEIHDLEPESKGRRKKKPATKLAQTISTYGGETLHLFSKSAEFGEDLYAGWIDKELQSTLYVETWRNGAGHPLNSSCPRDNYRVNNIQDLKVNQAGKKVTWSYHQDHSKWAISESEDVSMVCISDINRMQSQFKRGGGAVCIKCGSCWSVFSNTIMDLEPCPSSKKPKPNNQ